MIKRIVIFPVILIATAFSVRAGDIAMPPITEKALPNGFEITIIENHELPVVHTRLVIGSGSMRDPAGKEGLARFTANMLKKGTASRSANKIADEMDFVGGQLNISVDRDAITVVTELLTKHLDVADSILSDMVMNPVFAPDEIERYRKQVLNGILQSREDPEVVCSENFDLLLFGNHPYGHPVRGNKESVENLTRDDIVDFYNNYIRPNNAFLIVSGDVYPDDIIPRLEDAFGAWERKEISPITITTPPVPEGRKILLIDKPDATQSQIRFGSFGITRRGEQYYPFLVMNYILGAGVSFVNRLMTEVRDKGGLTYDIRTVNEFNILPGAFYCNTSTENDSTLKAIEIALGIMKDMAENEVSDQEYRQAIDFYSGYYPTSLETPSQWARELARIKQNGLPDSYIKDFVKNIKKVKKSDILDVARFLIDTDNMAFCVVSSARDVKADLEKLGEVKTVSIDDL